MPGGTGFDLLNTLPNRTFKVIFTTASSAHALQAIKAHAEDYILKPIDIQELKQAINLCELHIKQLTPAYKKLLLPTASGHELVDVHDIMYITANDNYCTVHTASNNKKTLVSKTLKQYEALLCNSGFYRIHQSHIVNLNYVDKYLKGRGGYVKLKTGIVLDVSIRKKSDFLKELSKY